MFQLRERFSLNNLAILKTFFVLHIFYSYDFGFWAMVQKRPFDRHDRLQSVNLIEKDFMLVHTDRRFRGKQRKQAQMIRKMHSFCNTW